VERSIPGPNGFRSSRPSGVSCNGQTRTGKVLAVKDTQATIHEDGARCSWSVPYAAIEPRAPTTQPASAPEPPRAGRNYFRCAEKVTFEDKYLKTSTPW
jgi:hypothetical protein